MRSLAEKRRWESPFRVGAVPRGAQAISGAGDVCTGHAAGLRPGARVPAPRSHFPPWESHRLPSGPGPLGPGQRLSDLFWLQATVSRTLDTQPSPFYMSCTHIF